MPRPSNPMPWERSFRNFNTETSPGFRMTNNDMNNEGMHRNDANAAPPLPPRPTQQNNSGQFNMMTPYGGSYSPYNSQFYSPYRNFGPNNRFYGSCGNFSGSDSWFSQFSEDLPIQAFQSIEAAVRTVSSISMMLESTYQAIFSSFQAVIGVADHLSQTKSHIAQVLSTLTVIKTVQKMLQTFLQMLGIIKKSSNADVENAWRSASSEASQTFTENDLKMARSSWPLVIFFSVIFGIPWLIWKVLRSLSSKKESKSWTAGQGEYYVAIALYNFTAANNKELSFSKGQTMKLAPKELQPNVRGWLLASNDIKSYGLVPANYIQIIRRESGVIDCHKQSSIDLRSRETSGVSENSTELPREQSDKK